MNIHEYKRCMDAIDYDKLVRLSEIINAHTDMMILGNGGSNAVSAHIAQDYSNKRNKRALSFSDSAMMSCYANDFGWNNVCSKFIETFKFPWSLVILISSSGNSQNIVNAAQYCVDKGLPFVMLTGFDENNKLRTAHADKALLEFHIDSHDYGVVECLHELILHTLV